MKFFRHLLKLYLQCPNRINDELFDKDSDVCENDNYNDKTNFRFDEMHYGKYVAQYLKRTFFFDANPPLGKLLIAMAAYLADFDGKISLLPTYLDCN
jgi:hypothetical protein